MIIDLTVPSVGESITEVEIGDWLKKPGEAVRKDEAIVALESEKATVELPAPDSGTLKEVLKQKGEVAKVGEVIARLESNGAADGSRAKSEQPATGREQKEQTKPPRAPAAETSPATTAGRAPVVMPAAGRVLAEHGIKPEEVTGTGPGGRVLKEDVLRYVESKQNQPPAPVAPAPGSSAPVVSEIARSHSDGADREEELVPMSRLRRTVAERLVQAQHNAALLTTFNEIDMATVMALRKEHGEAFQSRYQVKLGFMSFFIKACVDALKQYPALNAEIRGNNIAYRNYYDIGVAVGSGKGLVVPIIRNVERLSFAELEMAVGDYGKRARENKLKVEELQGGTFTISNGGVYGSLLSTPIINPPQSGVLGMHAIQERPVAREGQVVIRPMMYVALTYDHRIVDGREAVSFLKRIKDTLENPARMLMEV